MAAGSGGEGDGDFKCPFQDEHIPLQASLSKLEAFMEDLKTSTSKSADNNREDHQLMFGRINKLDVKLSKEAGKSGGKWGAIAATIITVGVWLFDRFVGK